MSVLKNFPLASGLFFVVFFLSGSLASRNHHLSPRADSESLEEIEDLLRQVQLLFEMEKASKDAGLERAGEAEDGEHGFAVSANPCNCSGVECTCCQKLGVPMLRKTCCVKMTYAPDKKTILVSPTLDSTELRSKEVQVTATKPKTKICTKVPTLRWLGSLCIEFYDYKLEDTTVKGCLKLKAKVLMVPLLTYELGCFQLAPSSTIQHAGKAEPLYFEEDEDSVQGPW